MNKDKIFALAQDIYLAQSGEYADEDDQDEVDKLINETIGWVNQFLPELENEAQWNWLRTNDKAIATANESKIYNLSDEIKTLIYSPYRDLTIRQDGTVVSTFKLVNPNQIDDPSSPDTRDRATVVNGKLVLSRQPTEQEVGGQITADVISAMPMLSLMDTEVLDIVQPRQLIVLGVLKNKILPDIVQGGLSPSFAQKYNDLLQKCILENEQSSESDDAIGENLGFVRGVW